MGERGLHLQVVNEEYIANQRAAQAFRNDGANVLASDAFQEHPRLYIVPSISEQPTIDEKPPIYIFSAAAFEPQFVSDRPRVYLLPPIIQPEQPDVYISPAQPFYEESFGEDFAELERIRAFSKQALAEAGLEEDGKSTAVTKLFDIDKERWNFERCQTDERRAKFRQELYRQIVTALWEREKGVAAEFTYLIKDGELWSEFWDMDPLRVIYRRGYELKQKECEKKGGSPDAKREREEILGMDVINQAFTDSGAQIGTVACVISPPGKDYPGNYLMMYESLGETWIDSKQETRSAVRYKQYSVHISEGDYKKIALEIDPGYFNGFLDEQGKEVMPLDAWFKGRPFFFSPSESLQTIEDVYTSFFDTTNTLREEEEFDERIDVYDPHILYLITQITDTDEYKTVAAHIALHNLYVTSDQERKRGIQQTKEKNGGTVERASANPASQVRDMGYLGNRELSHEQYAHIAAQAQRNVSVRAESVQAGCGPSNGLKMKRNAMRTMFAGTVGLRGINSLLRMNARGEVEEDGESTCEHCPEWADDASDNHYHCLNCNWKYPDETNRAPEDRTTDCINCDKPLGCGVKEEEKEETKAAVHEQKEKKETKHEENSDKGIPVRGEQLEPEEKPVIDFTQYRKQTQPEFEEGERMIA